jgi:hypothetical protein
VKEAGITKKGGNMVRLTAEDLKLDDGYEEPDEIDPRIGKKWTVAILDKFGIGGTYEYKIKYEGNSLLEAIRTMRWWKNRGWQCIKLELRQK